MIILNAGGYTHTSVALADAIAAIKTPVIEVHISNIYAREEFRQKSLLSPNCKAVICGLGLDSYKSALTTLISPKSLNTFNFIFHKNTPICFSNQIVFLQFLRHNSFGIAK